MKWLFTLLILSSSLYAKKLTLEAIYSESGLSGPKLRSPKFSPDSKLVTYLKSRPDDAKRYDLWAYDLAAGNHARLVNSDDLHSGVETLSDEEKARRERMRLNASGIVSYSWSKDGSALLFPLAGDLYYYELASKEARQLTRTEEFEIDAKFSPDGKKVSFIRSQNIIVLDLASQKETALTTDGKGPIKNGMAEFVAQEEMGRHTGYWWGPESKQIAYIQVDESPVEEVLRNEIYPDRIKTIKQRYPYTGEANAKVKLAVIRLSESNPQWIDTGKKEDFYLPRVKWSESPDLLTYQWQSRDQHHLELRGFNPKTGAQTILVKESSKTWINLHKDLHFFKENDRFIWASERSGFKHLYLGDKAITKGNWVVNSLESVNEKQEQIYFTGWMNDPTERHLYRVNLPSGSPTKITKRAGWHNITFSKDSAYYFDHFSSPSQPTQVSLHRADGSFVCHLNENKLDENHPLHPYLKEWVKPEFGVLNSSLAPPLHYRLIKPKTAPPANGFPAIVYVYGGPGAQMVKKSWGSQRLFEQYLVQQGYACFSVDGRGSENRGKKFEDYIDQKLGDYELRDQVAGVNWLKKQPFIDGSRIGIHGHSYGGYMTLMAMFRTGDLFACGISGAPVTDFRLYDTHYTERFLDTPQNNPDGYEATSVFPYTNGLKGDLLLYHGMADDNVLFKNSTQLMRKLQEEGKLFEFMAYPGEKHGISDAKARLHLARTKADFFKRKLQR